MLGLLYCTYSRPRLFPPPAVWLVVWLVVWLANLVPCLRLRRCGLGRLFLLDCAFRLYAWWLCHLSFVIGEFRANVMCKFGIIGVKECFFFLSTVYTIHLPPLTPLHVPEAVNGTWESGPTVTGPKSPGYIRQSYRLHLSRPLFPSFTCHSTYLHHLVIFAIFFKHSYPLDDGTVRVNKHFFPSEQQANRPCQHVPFVQATLLDAKTTVARAVIGPA